jgi:hypothetical protein
MADQIVSWGGFNSKGTDGMGVTGSFQVSSSANSFFVGGGNVGIGTPTPSASLHISGSSGSVLFEIDSNSQQNILYVSGSGRVGIGTSTPSYNLEVSSTGYTGLGIMSGANSLAEINFQNRGYGVSRWTIRAGGVADGSSGNLTFQRLASTFPFTITSGDNILVGVGTDIGARLGVRGSGTTSSTTALLVQNANASASLSVLDNSKVVIGTETVSQGSLYIGHNGTSGGSNGTSTIFFASQFGGNYPYRLGAEGNGYDFYLRQANGGQGSVNIDFSGLNNISYTITNTNILNQTFATSSIIVSKSTLNSYLAIGNTAGLNNSQTTGDTPLIFFRSMTGGYYDKTVDAAVTIRNGSPTVADDNINKNTAFWYRNGYIGIGTSTSLFATNTLQGALTINQGTNTGYANRFPTTASLVNTSGTSTTVTFTPDNGNTAASYNIIVGTIITANSASRKVTAVRYNSVTVDTAVDWSVGYPYTYRNPYVSIADGSTPIFDISPSGSVGIGITTPSASLHISGASSNVLLEIDSPAVNNILYVSGSGNVGIGTGTPARTLEVNGTIGTSADGLGRGITMGTAVPGGSSYLNVGQGTGWIFNLTTNNATYTANSTRMSITDNGVGFGNFVANGGTVSSTAQVRGSGTTSATTALLVQNANASASFSVRDDLQASVGDGFAGDGIRFEAGNNSAIVFRQGADRIAMTRLNSDKLNIRARGTDTVIGEGISTNSSAHTWLLEGEVSASVAMDTTKYVKIFINGVVYKLAICV